MFHLQSYLIGRAAAVRVPVGSGGSGLLEVLIQHGDDSLVISILDATDAERLLLAVLGGQLKIALLSF